jgi:MFS family permease
MVREFVSNGRAGARVTSWSAAAALAGLVFGFDVAVISGAEQAIQKVWALDPTMHGLVVSMALWGTVVGALFASWPTDGLGRKKTLILVAVCFLVGAVGSALAPDPISFSFFRFLGGLAIGVSSIAAPAYISEIAPPDRRGFLVGLYQFNIVAGILLAYVSNWLVGTVQGAESWRWMLGVLVVPSALFFAATLVIPESPMWREGLSKTGSGRARWGEYLLKPLRRPASLAIAIALFNQLSGINAVIYFAPRIFASAGLGESSALLASAGIGVVNLLATALAIALIDRFGRKTLMTIGVLGYCVSLGAVALAFALDAGQLVAPFVFLFIASHAIGQGAVIWVFIAEIFPTRARARGQSLGSGTHWVMAALITLFMPPALAALSPQTIFAAFFVLAVLQLVWVRSVMPETGRSAI